MSPAEHLTHERARELASAAYDGELSEQLRPALGAHLDRCQECRVFADAMPLLTTLAAAAPRATAPARLWDGVVPLVGRRRSLRWSWALAPVLTAVTVLALVVAVPGTGTPLFPLPPAGAAAPLLELRSLYVERTVVTVTTDAAGVRLDERTAVERVWFAAPGMLRTETQDPNGTEVVIERPGLRWSSSDGLVVGLVPRIVLPEPLSPTLAELGRDVGPGPVVAGRPTRRVLLEVDGERREALVDAERPSVLGSEQAVVLAKGRQPGTTVGGTATTTKRVRHIDLDPDLPASLFEPPAGTSPGDDAENRRVSFDSLITAPEALPRGFQRVLATRGPAGEALLLARGALAVLVQVEDTSGTVVVPDGRTVNVTVAGRPALLWVPLYGAPLVRFGVDGRVVTVSAPLPSAALIALAARLYPG